MRITTYPCIKAGIGTWAYYVTSMKFTDVCSAVRFAHEFFPKNDLDKVLQRKLTSRSKQIAAYLSLNDERFFGSLIVATYDGEPNFIPITIPDSPLLGEVANKIGILRFDGTEKYYALDGQHRLAAIKEVMEKDPKRYEKDEVSVVIVCHKADAEGLKRARRLFTTLNRYAKKTTKAEDLVMDEDNPADILTRRFIREDEFFRHRIKILRKTRDGAGEIVTGEAMSIADKRHLMALLTFKRCNQALLSDHFKKSLIPQQLPSLDDLDAAYDELLRRWKILLEEVDIWRELSFPETTLEAIRHEKGGSVLARPIGIVAFCEACGMAFDAGIPNAKIKQVTDSLNDITKTPWNGLLWNPFSKKMYDGQVRRKAAISVWAYYLGVSSDLPSLEKEWSSLLDQSLLAKGEKLPPAV